MHRLRPTDVRDIPYMQSVDIHVINLNCYPDECVLCGKTKFLDHCVPFYEEPVHQEIGSLMPNGDKVGGMTCCKECHDKHHERLLK